MAQKNTGVVYEHNREQFIIALLNDPRMIGVLANTVADFISESKGDDALDQAELDIIAASMEEPEK